MSANAGSWFYTKPEEQAYLISERINGSFWQARVYEVYWTCTKDSAPYVAEGILPDGTEIKLEWEAGKWLALTSTETEEFDRIADLVATRVLLKPADVKYIDADGNRGYEWHLADGDERWGQIQGVARYSQLQRLS